MLCLIATEKLTRKIHTCSGYKEYDLELFCATQR